MEHDDHTSAPRDERIRSGRQRVTTAVLDLMYCAVIVAVPVTVVVVIAAPWLSAPVDVGLGIWTGLMMVGAVPALVVLYVSPPRVPLSKRSALFASATWFGRAVGAAAVFSLSIVLGSVAGVIASRVSETDHHLGAAVSASIAALVQLALWPIVLSVAAFAYLATGIRWLLDLGRIVDEGGARMILMSLEARWFGPREVSPRGRAIRDAVSVATVSIFGRIALSLAMLTVVVTVAVAAYEIFRA